MVGGDVERFDLRAAAFADRLGQRVGARRQPVVGGEDEEVGGGERGGGFLPVEGVGVGDQFVGHDFGRGAGEGFLAVFLHARGELVARGLGEGAEVGGGDQHRAEQIFVLRGGERGDPAAHAVADDDEAFRVDAQLCGIGGIAREGEDGVRVLEILGEAIVAGAAP